VSELTRILSAVQEGDPHAAEQLLPLVYDELRKLAAQKLAQEKPGQTLEATALVHEAYLRIAGGREPKQHWDSRGHFFSAAAEAMRRILVENTRRKRAQKRGGSFQRVELSELAQHSAVAPLDLLALDEALTRLQDQHPQKAQVMKLRFFAGCTLEETASMLGISARTSIARGPAAPSSRATAQRDWDYARAWLFGQLKHT
jgi:RNA polymerase sigma factor (TIGR02999 family)